MITTLSSWALLAGSVAAATTFQIDSRDHIVSSARTLASDLMSLYHGNEPGQIPGLLPGPPSTGTGDFYWWNGGALMGTMVDYWRWTGDATYNSLVSQALLFQLGQNNNYMPANQSASEGNDDQCIWGLAAMAAAEAQFPSPPQGQPSWVSIAQAVFDTQAERIKDETACNGGLRWQIFSFNVGYDYKNSASNACLFNLAARLFRFTGNQTYSDVASSTYHWLATTGLLKESNYAVYDGAHASSNCTDISGIQWSYTSALLTEGAAYMYNQTAGAQVWQDRATKLTAATLANFFPNNIAFEISCEEAMTCSTDSLAFKGLTHRWLASATQVAPFLAESILPVLTSSAQAAVNQCTGAPTGRKCGFQWSKGAFESGKTDNINEQMDVLAAVSGLLVNSAAATASNATTTDKPSGPGSPTPSTSTTPSAAIRLDGAASLLAGSAVWIVLALCI